MTSKMTSLYVIAMTIFSPLLSHAGEAETNYYAAASEYHHNEVMRGPGIGLGVLAGGTAGLVLGKHKDFQKSQQFTGPANQLAAQRAKLVEDAKKPFEEELYKIEGRIKKLAWDAPRSQELADALREESLYKQKIKDAEHFVITGNGSITSLSQNELHALSRYSTKYQSLQSEISNLLHQAAPHQYASEVRGFAGFVIGAVASILPSMWIYDTVHDTAGITKRMEKAQKAALAGSSYSESAVVEASAAK